MKRLVIVLLVFCPFTLSAMDDDPRLTAITIDKLEWQEENTQLLEGEFWVGRDLSKWVIDTDLERHEGETEDLVIDLYHRRAVSAFWDFELGLSQRLEGHDESRLRLGVKGLAPWFIETTAVLNIGDEQTELNLEFEHELWLNADWAIHSGLELNVYEQLRDQLELRLLLKYERHKNLHPYLGIEHKRLEGSTTRTSVAAGLSFWF